MDTDVAPTAVDLILVLDDETVHAEFDALMNSVWTTRPPRNRCRGPGGRTPRNTTAQVCSAATRGDVMSPQQAGERERSPPRQRSSGKAREKKVMPIRRNVLATNSPAVFQSEL